jgi:hypothetical protein
MEKNWKLTQKFLVKLKKLKQSKNCSQIRSNEVSLQKSGAKRTGDGS